MRRARKFVSMVLSDILTPQNEVKTGEPDEEWETLRRAIYSHDTGDRRTAKALVKEAGRSGSMKAVVLLAAIYVEEGKTMKAMRLFSMAFERGERLAWKGLEFLGNEQRVA